MALQNLPSSQLQYLQGTGFTGYRGLHTSPDFINCPFLDERRDLRITQGTVRTHETQTS